MASINIDHLQALAILKHCAKVALSETYRPMSMHHADVEMIVTGSHLTYRYLLVTALLGKASHAGANPLALQAGAKLEGAYDARSLCHKVIVPHEPELLGNALGGSNEPFLNKPARFPEISASNAVRAGKDRRTLRLLVDLLSRMLDSDQARVALQDALYFAAQSARSKSEEVKAAVKDLHGGRQRIQAFIKAFVTRSIHGETSMLIAGAVFWVISLAREQEWQIQVHPSNEAGSSSNEISDIDVWQEGRLIFTAEVKDKAFHMRDVIHALAKLSGSGLHRLYFIKGPRAELVDGSEEELHLAASRSGVELIVLGIEELARITIALAPDSLNLASFASKLTWFAESARAKAETLEHLMQVMEAFGH